MKDALLALGVIVLIVAAAFWIGAQRDDGRDAFLDCVESYSFGRAYQDGGSGMLRQQQAYDIAEECWDQR